MSKKIVKLGSSYTIGSHILPGEPLIELGDILDSRIKLTVLNCDEIIEGVKNQEFDFGLIESPVFDESLVYKKWMEDELVMCSKASLGDNIDADMMSRCQLLCRIEDCPTRQTIAKFFNKHGLSYTSFASLMQVDNGTSAIQGIKWSRPNTETPTVAIVSEYAIKDELERKELYAANMLGEQISRDYYLIHIEEESNSGKFEEIVLYLQNWHEANKPSR